MDEQRLDNQLEPEMSVEIGPGKSVPVARHDDDKELLHGIIIIS